MSKFATIPPLSDKVALNEFLDTVEAAFRDGGLEMDEVHDLSRLRDRLLPLASEATYTLNGQIASGPQGGRPGDFAACVDRELLALRTRLYKVISLAEPLARELLAGSPERPIVQSFWR